MPRSAPRSRARGARRSTASNARPRVAPEQVRDECGGVARRPLGDAAAVAPGDVLAPRPHGDLVGRAARLPHSWRDDLDHRPDLGGIQTRARRPADGERNALAVECHDLGRAAGCHVFVVAVPQREQDMAMLGDENADRAVLLGALVAVARTPPAIAQCSGITGAESPARATARIRRCCQARGPARNRAGTPRAASATGAISCAPCANATRATSRSAPSASADRMMIGVCHRREIVAPQSGDDGATAARARARPGRAGRGAR